MTFAVIETGGKQYRVSAGQKLKISKIEGAAQEGEPRQGRDNNAVLNFDKVLLLADGENVKIGAPYVEGAKIEAKILRQGRERKKIVFRYRQKTREKKKKGHRQDFTEVEISKISH